VNPTIAGHDAVTVHALILEPEVMGPVDDEPIEFNEGSFVEQEIEPLSSGELPFLVLRLEAGCTAAELRLVASFVEEVQLVTHRHGAKS
jgi:hypothetical protein